MVYQLKEDLALIRKEIDNRGLACPQPVLNTKKALEELAREGHTDFILTVIVDNEAARENVSRFARTAGCLVSAVEKEGCYHIIVQGGEKKEGKTDDGEPLKEEAGSTKEEQSCCLGEGSQTSGETVMFITSSTLGQGSEELGKILMRSFIFTLKEISPRPSKLFFLNSGVFLTTEGSPVLEELSQLAAEGVEIFSCGTCLDYYNLKDKLRVGQVTNMYDTVETMQAATKCIVV